MTFHDIRAYIHYDKILSHFLDNAWTTRGFFWRVLVCFFAVSWTNIESEAFCVKRGPNEDHFSNLLLMRTKSSIKDLFTTTGSGIIALDVQSCFLTRRRRGEVKDTARLVEGFPPKKIWIHILSGLVEVLLPPLDPCSRLGTREPSSPSRWKAACNYLAITEAFKTNFR